jgi:hypothetical protein
MAEIAFPLVVLGGMYIASSQENKIKNTNANNANNVNNIKKVNKEGLTNMSQVNNSLPGVNPQIHPKNYPIESKNANQSNISRYQNSNQHTDKYYDTNNYANIEKNNSTFSVGNSVKQNVSLTGNKINTAEFKHNNMVPFFGGKIKGATVDMNVSESALDNMQGQGSQHIKKQEQSPLFQPHQNLQYANGAPNASDFIQSRVNPSMRMANVKPWEEQRVAPGLNKGFTNDGGAGFNSGMESREKWLPKTVNELRVDTNSKTTFGLSGHEGPVNSFIKTAPSATTQGKVEKHLPDSYYKVGPERWFTTTGLEKAQTSRGVEVLRDVNRLTTSEEYYGTGGVREGEASYAKGEYEDPKRPVLAPNQVTNAGASGKNVPTVADYGSQSFSALPNHRSTTKKPVEFGVVSGIVNAMMSPILDILRPSRKENVVGNIRPNGNAGSTVSKGIVFNPADRTKTTIREMTEGELDCNHLNIEKQNGTGYLVNKHQPVNLQRDTTTNISYTGAVGTAEKQASMSYDAAYKQNNNMSKPLVTVPYTGNAGSTQTQETMSYDAAYKQNNNISKPLLNVSYSGGAGPSQQKATVSYESAYKQHNNVNKTYPNRPNQGGTQIFNQTDNISIQRKDDDRNNNRLFVPNSGPVALPTMETHGSISAGQQYNQNINCERISPDILTAFKNNPYTQSLNSWK